MNKVEHHYDLTRWLFFIALGLIYLMAFVSLGIQIIGLAGEHGIVPAETFLRHVEEHLGAKRFWEFPTVFWLNASDTALMSVCWGGAVLSILLVCGVAPTLTAFLLWFFYLSLMLIGQVFLSFQWDALLVETGFLAIFFAGRNIKPMVISYSTPSFIGIWLMRILLFKLMFSSGMVKLLSGDKTWRDLTALTYHYMTQPLANPFSWYVYNMPLWFHRISCVLLFAVELVVPFFIFMGRTMRLIAFWANVFFQLLIISTGNYCFFNLLALALCLMLLDDERIKPFLPVALVKKAETLQDRRKEQKWEIPLAITLAGLIGLTTLTLVVPVLPKSEKIFNPAQWVVEKFSSFQSVNNYGLFAVMTTKRPEIIIEGSQDARTWYAYEFRWKPGRLDRIPGQVAPHQPRLDWQMWFAALGSYRYNPWLINFMKQLLKGSRPVEDLLQGNPFRGYPPKYIRASLYDYTFTDPPTRVKTGNWWNRKYLRPYTPVLTLDPDE